MPLPRGNLAMQPTWPLLFQARKFRVVLKSVISPRGIQHQREVIEHPGAVVILPFLDQNHVCLIRNFRVAVEQTLLELPAGTLEPDEDPTVTAHRELLEETGYRAGHMQRLASFWMSPGILSERMHLFLATDLQAGPARPEADEEIELCPLAWPAALAQVARGEIQDAKTIAGLLFHEQFGRSLERPT